MSDPNNQQSSSITSSTTSTTSTSTIPKVEKVIFDKPYQCNPQSIIEYFYYNGWNKRNATAIKDVMDENIKLPI